MKGGTALRILAVSLFVALVLTPAIVQEGLASLWVSLGQPLLTFAAVLAILLGLALAPAALARGIARRRERTAGSGKDDGEPRDGEGARDGEAAAEADEVPANAGEEQQEQPEVSLADALSELEPDNFMDLARALQEMGRDADTLEVLARVVEGREGEHGDEVAEALRRLRRKLNRENPGNA